MFRYTLKRLVNAFVILIVIATATWFLMQLLPGSPFNDQKLTPEARAQIEAEYGLNDPLLVQYARYMGNLAQGDLGNSYQYSGKPVMEIILERLPVSAFLGTQAMVLGVIGGLLLGVIGAVRHNSLADSGAAFLAVLGVSIPDFVLAPLAQYWLAFQLGLFPPAFFESWWHSVLPSKKAGGKSPSWNASQYCASGASTKSGMETPSTARNAAPLSARLLCLTAPMTPSNRPPITPRTIA